MAGRDMERLQRQVRLLVDRAEISDLIARFSRDLDDYTLVGRSFDVAWVRSTFTDDATVDYPVGSATGAEEGDYYEGEVVRTADGWRFRGQALHVTWSDGTPPA